MLLVRGNDANLCSDGLGCDNVISCDHPHLDTCLLALDYSAGNLWSGYILDSHYGNHNEPSLLNIIDTIRVLSLAEASLDLFIS